MPLRLLLRPAPLHPSERLELLRFAPLLMQRLVEVVVRVRLRVGARVKVRAKVSVMVWVGRESEGEG